MPQSIILHFFVHSQSSALTMIVLRIHWQCGNEDRKICPCHYLTTPLTLNAGRNKELDVAYRNAVDLCFQERTPAVSPS